ncbi:MAG TPA: GTPase domain-containing protein [Pseudomonadota bacterium]|nr:GTPase domain-containing protein [Pseudomonadota bacterium]
MAQVENAPPSIAIKLVFCGPFGSGKTTNLNQLYSRLNDRYRSRMLSLDPTQTTDAELLYHTRPVDADHRPTMFFDLLPIVLSIAGVRVVLRLLAGPGHVMHDHTRRLLLRGADGIAFVADSQLPPEENEQALIGVRTNLRDNGLAPDTLPLVIQLNKGERPTALTDAAAAKRLLGHRADVHIVPAIAKAGVGVIETVLRLVSVVWPALVHEHEVLAASELDLATLLRELARTLNAGEHVGALGEPSRRDAADEAAALSGHPIAAGAARGAAFR